MRSATGRVFSRRWDSGAEKPSSALSGLWREWPFRFDDREGRGTWYCNQCGAGTAWNWLKRCLVSPRPTRPQSGCRDRQPATGWPGSDGCRRAETEAARKNAAALAQTLMAKPVPEPVTPTWPARAFPAGNADADRHTQSRWRELARRWPCVPLYDDSGELVNLQLISADGVSAPWKADRSGAPVTPLKDKSGRKTSVDSGGIRDRTYRAHLTGETVMVALSSVNLLSLAALPGRSIRPVRLSLLLTVT